MRIAIDWKKRGREFAILSGISLFLAFLRPFGTGADVPLVYVFFFWWLLIVTGSLIGEVTVWAYYKLRPDGPDWLMIIITSLVTALGITFVLFALEKLSSGWVSVGEDRFLMLYPYVLVISFAMTLVGYTLSRAFDLAGPDFVHAANDRDAVEAFLKRLPVKFHTADLWAIASEDHYCRVYTSLGSELILMRLADADRELADADGLRVHRSWWVARKGVANAERSDGRVRLKLRSGEDVPVSRSYQSAVKDAGFIA